MWSHHTLREELLSSVMTLWRVVVQVPNQQIHADEPYPVIAPEGLGLCETMLGKEFPSTLTSMNNLAGVLRDRGNYEETERDVFLERNSTK